MLQNEIKYSSDVYITELIPFDSKHYILRFEYYEYLNYICVFYEFH